MKRIFSIRSVLFFTLLMAVSLSVTVFPVHAQSRIGEASANQALCLPDPSAGTGSCLLAGPSQRLNELAAMGITFPAQPLPLTHPAYDLFRVPFSYALLDNEEIPLYASVRMP